MRHSAVDERSPFVDWVLRDEGITRGLDDPEARLLIDWLVETAETLAGWAERRRASAEFPQVLRRCRGLKRFVILWCYERDQGAAAQLAQAEGFLWPLPRPDEVDPCHLLERLLACELVFEEDTGAEAMPSSRALRQAA
jgi:hypothetical protein